MCVSTQNKQNIGIFIQILHTKVIISVSMALSLQPLLIPLGVLQISADSMTNMSMGDLFSFVSELSAFFT
jgi:hypothetical protein